jgi:hypothetical protein
MLVLDPRDHERIFLVIFSLWESLEEIFYGYEGELLVFVTGLEKTLLAGAMHSNWIESLRNFFWLQRSTLQLIQESDLLVSFTSTNLAPQVPLLVV